MTERLTTLAAVKQWLNINSSDSDLALTRVIDAASQFVLSYLNRDGFAAQEYTQNCRGNGKDTMLLRNWPVLSVTSVGIGGSSITQSVVGNAGLPGGGYILSDHRDAPQSVDLFGSYFGYRVPCRIVYTAGYQTSQTFVLEDDAGTVSETPTNGGQWVKDVSVTLNGTPATRVTGTPGTGQYKVDDWGVYTFNAGDIGKTAVIMFAYVPWDISQGTLEIISEMFKRKDRIGILSKSLTGGVGESVTYQQSDMTMAVRAVMQPYRNVIPV